MIQVMLVDDQALVRSGLRMLLDAADDVTVVAEADNGQQALDLLAVQQVDVVLMDVRMPLLDGVETTARIVESGSSARVLVLTTFDLDDYLYAALRAGASGFMLKDARPEELLSAIRAVAVGDAVVAPSATRRLLDNVVMSLPDGQARPDTLAILTDREREVLQHIATGATNAEISQALFMAEGTVKTHVGRLLGKLQARDRVQLVLIAYETGLVPR